MKIRIVCLFLCLSISILSSCKDTATIELKENECVTPDGVIYQVITAPQTSVNSIDETNLPLHMRCLYKTLSQSDKVILNLLTQNINDINSRIPIYSQISASHFENLYNLLLNYQLDNFYLSTDITYTKDSTTNNVTVVYLKYKESKADAERLALDVQSEAKNCISNIPENASDLEKVKFIHDYLVLNCTYIKQGKHENDLYGILFQQEGVCEGYAKAFSYLANMLNIESVIVTGEANGKHMWNKVKLDGKWYNIDITWDDSDNGNTLLYDYFLISDKRISITHTEDNLTDYPEANTDYKWTKE